MCFACLLFANADKAAVVNGKRCVFELFYYTFVSLCVPEDYYGK